MIVNSNLVIRDCLCFFGFELYNSRSILLSTSSTLSRVASSWFILQYVLYFYQGHACIERNISEVNKSQMEMKLSRGESSRGVWEMKEREYMV